MSGDVQPRKRRDKKKKKDDSEDLSTQQQFIRASTPLLNEDINIHVHKDSATGGGICAKIVFFFLLGTLGVLIGLIITEYRGLTDLDTIETETRFSQIFETWIDKSQGEHDDHGTEHSYQDVEHEEHEDDDHDDDHDDQDDDHDEDHADDHDEDQDEHEQNEENELEKEDLSKSLPQEDDDEEDEPNQSEDVSVEPPAESGENDDEEESQEVDLSQNEEEDASQQDEDVSQNVSDEDASQNEDEDEDEDDDASRNEDEDASKNEDDDVSRNEGEDASKNEDDNASQNEDEDASKIEEDDVSHNDEDDDEEGEESKIIENAESEEKDSQEVEESKEKSTPQKASDKAILDESQEVENLGDEDDNVEAEAIQDDAQANTGVGVKLGVGAAILVVAYVVLVRKWKSDKNTDEKLSKTEDTVSDLSRRNTIVVPPKIQEVEKVIYVNDEDLEDEEEYSEEEIEEEINLPQNVKQDYQVLRKTYERSLSPESDIENIDRSEEDYDEEGDNLEEEYDEEENDNAEEEEEEELTEDEVYEEEEEEEEEDLEDDLISDDGDDDILKKFEEKYGKIPSKKSDGEEESERQDEASNLGKNAMKKSGENAVDFEDMFMDQYDLENVTNEEDYLIRDQLDYAQQFVENKPNLAVTLFNKILHNHPESPRALFGKAQSLDKLADIQRSNELLKEAIATYSKAMESKNIRAALLKQVGERCIDRMRFIGQYGKLVNIHKILIKNFPEDVNYPNQLAVTYLTTNRIGEARELLKKTLQKWPNNGVALVHMGFILKVNDNNLELGAKYLEKGIKTRDTGVTDGRFYFHLGDALNRLGKYDLAKKVYKDGVKSKVFLSEYQRSLYNVDRLTGKPWWNKSDLPKYQSFWNLLEKNYKEIAREGLAILNEKTYFQNESENLRDTGDWKQFELFARGLESRSNCKRCPFTCKIIKTLPDATGCRRGQIKFSVMHPGTHVWPHCGPTNCRLRMHLGLKVPPKTFIRVEKITKSWEEGKVFTFDDSFEHEVWHNGSEFRLVLIVDVWHPELTDIEKKRLSAI